jgi:hypothetical protein
MRKVCGGDDCNTFIFTCKKNFFHCFQLLSNQLKKFLTAESFFHSDVDFNQHKKFSGIACRF